jgi:hypothetical protein
MFRQAATRAVVPAAQQHARTGWRTGAVCGLLALAVYVASVAPSVEWQDPGRHQYRYLVGQIEHPNGLALSHPVHFWIGQLVLQIPYGEPAWRISMISVVFGAIAVAALAALVERLTNRRLAGFLAALVLLVSHSFWQMASTTEMYTLDATLMICEWLVLLEYVRGGRPAWLVLLFAVNGLHVAHHLLGTLALAAFGLLVLERLIRRKLHPAWLLACAAAWIVSCAPYWTMVLSFYLRTHNLLDTLHSAFFGGGEGVPGWVNAICGLNLSRAQLQKALLALGYNFPSFTLLLALPGVLRPAHGQLRQFRWVLLVQTVLMFAFVFRYRIADLYTFFVPIDVLVALWFGLGVDWIWQRLRAAAARRAFAAVLAVNAVLPALVYGTFPIVARQRHWLAGRWHHRPFRNEYAYFFHPWRRGDYSAAQFARDALQRTGPGGWLLAESTTAPTVAYWYMVHGGPANLQIFLNRVCLTSGRADLTDQDVVDFIRSGGNVLIAAGENTELDRSDPDYWRIVLNP